ncbi:UNVERIFIED_CONTAM: hypothetical protein FKN15_051771 [Acipenser sinensis]
MTPCDRLAAGMTSGQKESHTDRQYSGKYKTGSLCWSCPGTQTQTAQTLNMKSGENFMQRMAVFLGIMGFGTSGYSSCQLTMQKSSRPSF